MTGSGALDLGGVNLKIDRAEEHLNALAAEIDAFVGDPSYIRLESRLNRLDDSYSVILHVTEEIPRRWGVVVGDVCHNLRSALDHLVVATIPPGQAHRRHQFPIFDSDQSWNSEFGGKRRDKMLDFVDPARVSLIEEVQPYKPTGVARLSVLERFRMRTSTGLSTPQLPI